jgi:hypothetical protein
MRLQRRFLSTACVLVVSLGAANAPLAQSDTRSPIRAPSASEDQWTVLTDAKAAGSTTTWKTIALGTYSAVNILREDLLSLNCGLENSWDGNSGQAIFPIGAMKLPTPRCALGDSALAIIDRPAFVLRTTKAEVNLVVLSVSELGFGYDGAPIAEVYARAKRLGFELCPPEVGPQLRLQYLDQPLSEFLHIAMEPIATRAGGLVQFTVANGGSSLLLIGGVVGGDAPSDSLVHSRVRFVFVYPRE